MKLKDSLLCLSCDEVFAFDFFQNKKAPQACPACGEGKFVWLSRWIMPLGVENKKGENKTWDSIK